MMRAFRKCNFLLKLSDLIKSYDHLSKILANFSHFLPDLSLIILISRDHGCQTWKFFLISPGSPINFRKSHRISKNYLKSSESYEQKLLGGP